jgi:hypothetical protein
LENEIKGLEGTIKKLEERFVFVEIRGRKAILDTKTGSIVNILEMKYSFFCQFVEE